MRFWIHIERAKFGCYVVETLLAKRDFEGAAHYIEAVKRQIHAAERALRS